MTCDLQVNGIPPPPTIILITQGGICSMVILSSPSHQSPSVQMSGLAARQAVNTSRSGQAREGGPVLVRECCVGRKVPSK